MEIKLTRFSGAVDSVDPETGKAEGVAGGVRLESKGLTVAQALALAEAAPDLLAALRATDSAMYECPELDGIGIEHYPRQEAAHALARAAIAKAEGRA